MGSRHLDGGEAHIGSGGKAQRPEPGPPLRSSAVQAPGAQRFHIHRLQSLA